MINKTASLYKKADPPNRGIHDPNPMVAWLNRHGPGYVPQIPGTFLGDANSPVEFWKYVDPNDTSDEEELMKLLRADWERLNASKQDELKKKQEEAYANQNLFKRTARHLGLGYDSEIPKQYYDFDTYLLAASTDMMKRMGLYPNSMAHNVEPWRGDKYSVIHLGSFPNASDPVARHELGHAKRFVEGRSSPAVLTEETGAWQEAGIPAGDPVRESAIDTYRYFPALYELYNEMISRGEEPPPELEALVKDGPNVYGAVRYNDYTVNGTNLKADPSIDAASNAENRARSKKIKENPYFIPEDVADRTMLEHYRPFDVSGVSIPKGVSVAHDFHSTLDAMTQHPDVLSDEVGRMNDYLKKLQEFNPVTFKRVPLTEVPGGDRFVPWKTQAEKARERDIEFNKNVDRIEKEYYETGLSAPESVSGGY